MCFLGRYISSRAVRNGDAAVCEAAARVLIPLLDENINLPSTTRMNAAYTAVSLSQQTAWGSEAAKGALSDALGAASEDDDRYVAAASVEALKWLTLVNTTAWGRLVAACAH